MNVESELVSNSLPRNHESQRRSQPHPLSSRGPWHWTLGNQQETCSPFTKAELYSIFYHIMTLTGNTLSHILVRKWYRLLHWRSPRAGFWFESSTQTHRSLLPLAPYHTIVAPTFPFPFCDEGARNSSRLITEQMHWIQAQGHQSWTRPSIFITQSELDWIRLPIPCRGLGSSRSPKSRNCLNAISAETDLDCMGQKWSRASRT